MKLAMVCRVGTQALNCWLLIFEQYATFALSKPGDWTNKIMQDKHLGKIKEC